MVLYFSSCSNEIRGIGGARRQRGAISAVLFADISDTTAKSRSHSVVVSRATSCLLIRFKYVPCKQVDKYPTLDETQCWKSFSDSNCKSSLNVAPSFVIYHQTLLAHLFPLSTEAKSPLRSILFGRSIGRARARSCITTCQHGLQSCRRESTYPD